MKGLYVPTSADARIVEIDNIRTDVRLIIEGAAEKRQLGDDAMMFVNHYGSWLSLPRNERVAAFLYDLSIDQESEVPCGPVVITGCDAYGVSRDVPEHLIQKFTAMHAAQTQDMTTSTDETVDDEYSVDIDFHP